MRFAVAALPHTFPLREDPGAIDLARHWASVEAQTELLHLLEDEFDGFAVSLRVEDVAEDTSIWAPERKVHWSHRVPPAAVSARPRRLTEAIVIRSSRRPLYEPSASVSSSELLKRGQTAKSPEWTRWVIAHLGAIPGEDTVIDLFTRQDVPEFTTMLTLEGARP